MQTTLGEILARSSSATTTPLSASDWRPEFDAYEPSLAKATAECARFIAEMEGGGKPARWLTLTGKPGCGKTMLARQVLQRSRKSNPGGGGLWIGHGRPRPECAWIDATAFAERMKSGEYELPESFRNDWCVVLDDLGTARDKSDFIADGLYRFCNCRLGRWTVFTSNLTLPEISARVDERVTSRLIRDENRAFRIVAGDYAIEQMRRAGKLSA